MWMARPPQQGRRGTRLLGLQGRPRALRRALPHARACTGSRAGAPGSDSDLLCEQSVLPVVASLGAGWEPHEKGQRWVKQCRAEWFSEGVLRGVRWLRVRAGGTCRRCVNARASSAAASVAARCACASAAAVRACARRRRDGRSSRVLDPKGKSVRWSCPR